MKSLQRNHKDLMFTCFIITDITSGLKNCMFAKIVPHTFTHYMVFNTQMQLFEIIHSFVRISLILSLSYSAVCYTSYVLNHRYSTPCHCRLATNKCFTKCECSSEYSWWPQVADSTTKAALTSSLFNRDSTFLW